MWQQGAEQFRQAAAGTGDGDRPRLAEARAGPPVNVAGSGSSAQNWLPKPTSELMLKSPVHRFAQVMGQRQAQPGAAKLAGDAGAGLGEGLEDLHLRVLGNADAGVAHLDSYSAIRGRSGAHPRGRSA